MKDLGFTETQQAIRSTIREYLEREVEPLVAEMEAERLLPYVPIRRMVAALGFGADGELTQMIKDSPPEEMLKFFVDVTIPEFESDPIWWSAVNDFRGDNNTVFRVTMADHYQICSLGGCAASSEWLETHKDDIMQIAKRAFAAGMGKNRAGGDFGSRVTPFMVEQYNRMFTPAEQAKIELYFRQHPEQLKNLRTMTPVEAVEFMQRFKGSSLDKVVVQ